jgi:hypothetical protein
MSERVTLPSSWYGEAVGLAVQNIGRTGPIPPAPGGISWASLLCVALLLAGISVAVAVASARSLPRDAQVVLGLGGLVLAVLAHRSVQPLEVGVRPCRLVALA